jgi:very-short-patch-repair endonuclease
VVARRDLLALGFGSKAIRHRVETGRLRPLWRGVYAVGWIRRPGIKVHRRPALPERSVVRRHGIPVTSPLQTLVDLATELKPFRLERAVNEADELDLIDPEALRQALDDFVGMPGAKALRTMLDRHTFRLSDSDLEIFFRPLAEAAELPSPLSKQWVLRHEVEFWFPDHRLVVETDGLRYHRTPAQQARAARRDQVHTAAGLRVLRFTHWQIAYEPDEVIDILRRIRALG